MKHHLLIPISQWVVCILLILLCTACSTIRTTWNVPYCPNSMTDEDITTNVQTRIAGDTGLLDQNVLVNTYERTVTLSGTVENPTQRAIAICLARTVPHVKCVISRIKIRRYF